ncbi:MAG: hypothetical protein JWR74_1464 [Polaromonas sp.]|nr:hypothetical protein [Polaromonas sp.]
MKREHFGSPQDLTTHQPPSHPATQPISLEVLKGKYLKPGGWLPQTLIGYIMQPDLYPVVGFSRMTRRPMFGYS